LLPLVSVIIPVYNSEKYLYETLNSVLSQTYENIEVIVINDGSNDKSEKIILEFKEKYEKKLVYIYQDNSGVSSAKNKGLSIAKGEYIAFIDSDDLWEDTKIEKQINMIMHSQSKACYCGSIEWDVARNIKSKRRSKFIQGNILLPYLKFKIWIPTNTFIVERKLIHENKIIFTEGCEWGEDFEFYIKVASMCKMCSVKEYLAIYRKSREGSLTLKNKNKFVSFDVWKRLIKWFYHNEKKINNYSLDKVTKIINEFILPKLVIDRLYTGLYIDNSIFENNEQIIQFYNKYNENFKGLKLKYGLRCFKLYMHKLKVKNKIKNISI